MSRYSEYFDRCVNVVCSKKKVDRNLIFTPCRKPKLCDCRVMIFKIVNDRFPKRRKETQSLLNRKHPYYYHAEKTHSILCEVDREYRDDYETCKAEMVNFARKKIEIRKRINEAVEHFGAELDSATSFFVDMSKSEIWVNGSPIVYTHKANSPGELKR